MGTVALGNKVTLLGARAPGEVLRLVEADLARELPPSIAGSAAGSAGSWVVSLSAQDPTSGSTAGILILARVTLGSGGASQQFTLSVLPGCCFQVTAPSVVIDVSMQTGAPVPTDARVIGLIQRGETTSRARLLQVVRLVDAAVPQVGLVPLFGARVQLVTDIDSPLYGQSVSWRFGGLEISGRELRDLATAGEWLTVSPAASWSITAKPSATQLAYGFGFTANLFWELET